MELSKEMKNQMIQQRLEQYKQQIFTFEMDVIALQANGDEKGVKDAQENIDALKRAYEAVKGMA